MDTSTVATTADLGGDSPLIEGLVVDGNRGQYRIETAQGVLVCSLRGKLRKQLTYPISTNRHATVETARVKARDPIAVGDRVRVLPLDGTAGVIEEVLPRTGGAFVREASAAGGKGVITPIAGLDQIVAVFAARDPTPHLGLLDRFLVVAEGQDLGCIICLNKVDLGVDPALTARLRVYERAGYQVIRTSVAEGHGLEELRTALAGRTSALLGPSGVGKSSLLNALEPGLGQRVSAVGSSTHKGRHTTTGTRLVPLRGRAGGQIADTAGIRALALGGVGGRLAWCFREFRPFLGQCRHSDCSHTHEPGCAVQAAVETGDIDAGRYETYVRFYEDGADAVARAWDDVV